MTAADGRGSAAAADAAGGGNSGANSAAAAAAAASPSNQQQQQSQQQQADPEVFELVGFLGDATRADVQAAALGIVEGLTATQDGLNRLKPAGDALIARLFRLASPGAASAALARRALAALVNLSQDDALRARLVAARAVGRVMEALRDKACASPRLLTMLLANLTVDEAACEQLLQLNSGGMEGLHMALLLKLFVTSAVTLDAPVAAAPTTAAAGAGNSSGAATTIGSGAAAAAAGAAEAVASDDPCEHLGAVVTNVTRLAPARAMLLEPGRGLLQALAAQLAPGSSAGRRRGCAGALRNLCLSCEADGTLAALLEDGAVLERMLKPLSGGANADKDDNVREALAEAIAVLAATQDGCARLTELGAAESLRAGYELEEHPGVCAAMEAAGRHLFLASFGDDEGGDDDEAAAAAEAEAEGGVKQVDAAAA